VEPGFKSSGTLLLTPEWHKIDDDWDNGAEYQLPLDHSIQTILEMDMGGLPNYKVPDVRKRGYMPHFSVGVHVKTLKGDRVMLWDSWFNHIDADAHISDYGNGNIWLQYPSPVEHVRGWEYDKTDVWSHFKVDIKSELKKIRIVFDTLI
jgi:hypothetical protein